MNKKCDLRQYAKNTRKSSHIRALSICIIKKFKTLDIYKNAQNILTYSPLEGEIHLNLINFQDDKNWIFPKVEGGSLKTYYVKNNSQLKLGAFNVLEPSEAEKINSEKIELAIIPALMVDLKGHRLGYGKGFYDRFIPELNQNCPKIVLIQDELITDCLPINEFDKETDFILSDKRFIKL